MDKVNTHNEVWKYTPINEFRLLKFHQNNNLVKKNIQCKSNEIIMLNGCVYKIGKNIFKNNIQALNINEANQKNIKISKKLFEKIKKSNNRIYNYDKSNLSINGLFLCIPENTKISEPIIIKHHFDNKYNQDNILKYFYLFSIEKNVDVIIINDNSSKLKNNIGLTASIDIDKNSNIEFINILQNSNVKQLSNFFLDINNSSVLKYHLINITGKLLKNNFFINLNGQNSQCYFNGISISESKNHIDSYIEIDHKNQNTISDLNFKCIAKDSSKNILYAKAIIKKNSSFSEAYQKNNNLMLSEKSTIHSNPQLEIYNNDVQCSHGSTTGELDDDAIYYMMTRGINKTDAKNLLLKGFYEEILNKISTIDTKQYLSNKLDSYFKNELF